MASVGPAGEGLANTRRDMTLDAVLSQELRGVAACMHLNNKGRASAPRNKRAFFSFAGLLGETGLVERKDEPGLRAVGPHVGGWSQLARVIQRARAEVNEVRPQRRAVIDPGAALGAKQILDPPATVGDALPNLELALQASEGVARDRHHQAKRARRLLLAFAAVASDQGKCPLDVDLIAELPTLAAARTRRRRHVSRYIPDRLFHGLYVIPEYQGQLSKSIGLLIGDMARRPGPHG